MAAEVAELAVGVKGEDFAAVAAQEFDGGFESTRCIHGVFGLGMATNEESLEDAFGVAPPSLRMVQIATYL